MNPRAFMSSAMLIGLGLVFRQNQDAPPVSIRMVTCPYVVPNVHGTTVVYELLLSDYRADGFEMKKVEVFADGALLRTYTAKDLLSDDYAGAAVLVFPKEDAASGSPNACKQPVLYFAISLAFGETVPAAISHRIHFAKKDAPNIEVPGGAGDVNKEPPMAIGPPLRGSRLIATEAIAARTHHRKGIWMKDGRPFVSQRFAIDWFRLTEAGTMSTGAFHENPSYPGYGMDLLAVAPGTVAKVVTDVVDNQTPPGRDIAITDDTIAGDLVAIRIAENRYAFYGHCIPGSILVTEGDRVVAGQVIARMGNSGNSDAPHLHFQVADGLSLFEAQGIPYVIDRFSYDADYLYWTEESGDFGTWATQFRWAPLSEARPRASEFVANGMVVTFE